MAPGRHARAALVAAHEWLGGESRGAGRGESGGESGGERRERAHPRFEIIGAILNAHRVRIVLDVEVPRAASLQIDTVSGPIHVRDLAGEQRYRLVSGELRLEDVAGAIDASTVSGRVRLDATSDVALQARTVSGDVRVTAPLVRALRVATTSGEVRMSGRLAAGAEHRVSSVSGRLVVAASDLAIDMKSMTGSIRCDVPHRQESAGGRQRLIVGRGGTRLAFDSMSGGLEVVARLDQDAGSRSDPAADAPASPAAPGGAFEAGAATVDEHDQLDVLRALERGEIGVDEAAARLSLVGAAAGGLGPRASDDA